jgi:signal-transduction protein with cAMP-binding, CBS, and nucleotidyltransferase domain
MMQQGGMRVILVQDHDHPVGIVTDRDFATKIAANDMPFDTSAQKIISSPLITINHNELISAAAKRMTRKKIRKIAVAENGEIIGIITSTDLVTHLTK